MSQITHIIKRSGTRVPFNLNRISNAIYRAVVATGGRDRDRADELARKVLKKLEDSIAEDHIPHIEEIQDTVENILIENGHAKVAKAYILYREESARKRHEKSLKDSSPSENIPWAKVWHVLDWAVSHDLHTVAALNGRIRKGEFPAVVNESECAYEEEIATAADLISARKNELRLVFISGPSSSGKTTTTIKLEKRLEKSGLHFVPLNVDHYFFDLALHPKDEFGDYDFETPQALDLELINEHIIKLSIGEGIMVPFYDFRTGTRKLNVSPLKLKKDEILLIDSLHGLYPPMSEGVANEQKFKLYLEPLLQMKGPDSKFLRWTDLRMIRRMLRDASYRAYKPEQTLLHWHYVRASETRNIIPYIGNADYIINSAMPYEISIYKPKLLKDFKGWVEKYAGDPLREDAYKRAERVLKFLEAVEPVTDESSIPDDSVLREFIGGSVLKYHQ